MKKVVIITGASRGFGELIAKKFQKENFQVIATMRNIDSSPSLKKLENLDIKKLDVTVKSDIKNVVNYTVEKYGRIDILINNAGYGAFGFLEEASDEEIRNQFNVNYFGLIDCIKGVLPQMRKQKDGVIVNISSIAGRFGLPFTSLYNSSKFAVEGLTECLHYELSLFGIDIKTVAPGSFRTGFHDSINFTEDEKKEDLDVVRENLKKALEDGIKNQPPFPFGFGNNDDVANFVFKKSITKSKVSNFIGRDTKIINFFIKIFGRELLFKIIKKLWFSRILPKKEL
ncbi:MAG: SDR family oxidoreductase [Bacteroidota bacterium]|jgi:short-subunit dehydrogenase|nr:SDR family oxidoreductase [Bacteroidota bacterium]|tara:strand:+ start:1019 stop:1873 length:855 start_codon:yes stop_codon:yes gene_type:complete